MKEQILNHLANGPMQVVAIHKAITGGGVNALAFVLAMNELADDEQVKVTYHGVKPNGEIDPVGYDEPTDIPNASDYYDITQVAQRINNPS